MSFAGHPHTLAIASDRLRSLHVGQNNVSVELASVDKLCRRVEVGATVKHSFSLAGFALLPDVDLRLINASVERYDREGRDIG